MKTSTIKTNAMPNTPVGKAWDEVSASFDRFCLAAGIETLDAMMEADAEAACGPRHSRSADRLGHRWGRTAGKIGFHAGKVAMERPRVRGLDRKELPLPSWEQARAGFQPDITYAEACDRRARFFQCNPDIARWQDEYARQSRQKGYTQTVAGGRWRWAWQAQQPD